MEGNDDNNSEKENSSIYGSLAGLFTFNEFLQSQFSLATNVQKKDQIVLLKVYFLILRKTFSFILKIFVKIFKICFAITYLISFNIRFLQPSSKWTLLDGLFQNSSFFLRKAV